ncbi:MAG TPA: hypothetical protein VHB97_02905 [Polyangia bacterium]|nr:hypothetical protein [Polyangia bacterium]
MVASRSFFRGIALCASCTVLGVVVSAPSLQARIAVLKLNQHADRAWADAEARTDEARLRVQISNVLFRIYIDELNRAAPPHEHRTGDFPTPPAFHARLD